MIPVFGIHIGNTTANLAVCKDEEWNVTELVINSIGERGTPAMVTFLDDVIIIGKECKSMMASHWNTTVTCNKRFLNQDNPDQPNGGQNVVTALVNGHLSYVLPLENGEVNVSPITVAMHLYKSLYDTAKSFMSSDESNFSCVLMAPPHFTEGAKSKMRTAAETAGWDVMQVISEPSAVTLGYNMIDDNTPETEQLVLVCRIGGNSCDASIVEINRIGEISVLTYETSNLFGGKTLISSLTNYLSEEFRRKYKLDPRESHRSMRKLRFAAEECFRVLSTTESANCFVESLCEGIDFSHNVSRARLESLLTPHFPLFSKAINKTLESLSLSPTEVNSVLLCGGLMKVPCLKSYISSIFPTEKVLPIPGNFQYDELLAIGAAKQAGCLARLGFISVPDAIEEEYLKWPIISKVVGAECETIRFEAGEVIPCSQTVSLNPVEELITIVVTQHASSRKNEGQIQLQGIADPCELSIEINRDLMINVCIKSGPAVLLMQEVELYRYPYNQN